MTPTTTGDALPGPSNERLGVIGTRQLVAVQTLDIARLTAHPVCLIPETFIAITGMGPVDSNESGKTSFLSSVALLLGDPEWRITGTGVSSVAALLFEPVVAGLAIGGSAATEGYIVGLFAEPDDPISTAHTVWMRISAGRPHLQVRHAPGVHLARGMDDRERHEAAPALYKSLSGGPLGSTEYAHALYGRSPRVLAYVASRGRVRSRPSLLKLDAGTFTPEEIGDALIALSGRVTLFERDQQDRRDLADKQEELRRHIQHDREHTAREDEILRQVDLRQTIRNHANHARSLNHASQARAVLDTFARAHSAARLLTDSAEACALQRERLARLTEERSSLRDASQLQQTLSKRADELKKAKQTHDDAVAKKGELANQLSSTEQAARAARLKAAGHDLSRDGSPQKTASARDELIGQLSIAEQSHKHAEEEIITSEDALTQAREGQFGVGGTILRALAAAGIAGTALAEGIRLLPESRTAWEARLSPWKDAVCVPEENLDQALSILESMPGSIIVTGVAGHQDSSQLPAGILSAPDTAIPLLLELADHTAALEPVVYATDAATGLHIVGGFDAPIIGREEMRAHLEQRLATARRRASQLGQDVAAMQAKLELARITAARAEAAQELAALAPTTEDLTKKLATHRSETLPPLIKALEMAWEAHEAAKTAVQERQKNLDRLAEEIRTVNQSVQAKQAEIERLTLASRPDDAVLAAWGRGFDAARAQLRWPPEPQEPTEVTRLVDEATPPLGDEEAEKPERRRAAALLSAAQSQLNTALSTTRMFTSGAGSPPQELLDLSELYTSSQINGDDAPNLFDTLLTILDGWLADHADRDRTAHEEAALARATRAQTTEFVGSKTRELEQALIQTQQAISQRASGALNAISDALNKLNQASGQLGAELDHELTPPSAPDRAWVCRVIPRWRRNPGGPMLAYDNVTNTAQEKLFSIHLVLAALLAAPHPRGRVLILDELADSLGAEHRREVLQAIASVARDHGITILATCQDSIMVEARPYCREVLYFHYPSRSEALNRPTRMFGLDTNGNRIELTADAVIEGRGLGGMPPIQSPAS